MEIASEFDPVHAVSPSIHVKRLFIRENLKSRKICAPDLKRLPFRLRERMMEAVSLM
jgi:hypothetical protein